MPLNATQLAMSGNAHRINKNTPTQQPEFQSSIPDDYAWKNKDFATLAQNNPALQYQYTPGLWDYFGNAIGFRTGEDKFRDEQYNKALDYEAQMMQLDREEAYNSAEAQAQRMREAGINPNLAGGVEAGQASEFDNQAVAGQESPMTNQEQIKQTLDLGISALASVGNIVTTAFTIMGKGMDIIGKRQGVVNNIYSWVKDYVSNLPEGDPGEYFDVNQNFTEFSRNPKVQEIAPTRHEKRILWNAFHDAYKNMGVLAGRNKNRQTLNDALIEAEKSDIRYSEWKKDDTLQESYKAINRFTYEVAEAMGQYQKEYYQTVSGKKKGEAENNYHTFNSDYYGTASGTKMAEAHNAAWDASKAADTMKERLNSAIVNLTEGLAKTMSDPKANWLDKGFSAAALKALSDMWNTPTGNLVPVPGNFMTGLGIDPKLLMGVL